MHRLLHASVILAFAWAITAFAAPQVVGDGLAGHWSFDEGAGEVAADSSGGGHDGALMGDPQWTTDGADDGALEFDGDGDYVQTTLFDQVHVAEGITVATWFRTNVTDEGQQHLIWIGAGAGNGWGVDQELHLSINHFSLNNKLIFYYGSGGDADGESVNIASLEDFTDTADWHHLAGVVMDANGPTVTGALYLDGALVTPLVEGWNFPTTDSTTLVPDRSSWDTDLRIGAPGAAMRYFSGALDDVRVYTRALSAEEILPLATPVDPRGQLTTTWADVKEDL